MSQNLKNEYLLRVYNTSYSKQVNINNSRKIRASCCWDSVFDRHLSYGNNYEINFQLTNFITREFITIDEIPIMKELIGKLSKFYSIDYKNDAYVVKAKSIHMKIMFIRLIRSCASTSGREYLRNSMDFSSKTRKSLIYCLFIGSIYEIVKEKNNDTKSFMPDHSFGYNYSSVYKGENKLPYIEVTVAKYSTSKELMNLLLDDRIIYHTNPIYNKNAIYGRAYCSKLYSKQVIFESKQQFDDVYKKNHKEFRDLGKKYSLKDFEKMFRKHNKAYLALFNKK